MQKYVLGFVVSLFVLFIMVVGGQWKIVQAKETSDKIPDQYIVVLKDKTDNVDNFVKEHGLFTEHVYEKVLKGFSAKISSQVLEKIKADPRVEFVSEDRLVFASERPVDPLVALAQATPTGITRVGAVGLTNKGTNIGVAVIDTGINLTHPDLASNIVANKSCIKGKRNANDDNGHGTHVAGTIAAIDNESGVVGVAPESKLIAVKVLNSQGSGTWSQIICGIDWVTANATAYNIKVANMSLGGGGSSDNNCGNSNNDALHRAICNSRNAGITYVVAAGNSGANASTSVPAAYDDAVITVSALADSDGALWGLGSSTSYGPDDTFATFSNYGSVVDIGAPGVSIYSTYKNGGYAALSGTSMASPHVAGAAALYLKTHPGSSWTTVRNALITSGEALNNGHTDPSQLHPESIVNVSSF